MPKNVQTTAQLHSSHTLAKQCSKFSKPGFNSMWTMNFQIFKLDLEKAEELEIKLPVSNFGSISNFGSSKKQGSSRKTTTFALLTTPKPLTVWITTNYGKLLKRWEYQTTCPASWEICMQVRKQQLELEMEQHTGSKLRKEYVKAVYYYPAYLTYMPGKSHGWRSLVGCSPWGHEELDTTEQLHFHFSLSCIGEGNGNPLQCSCLENPRDGGACWAAIYGVEQSWTWLKWLSSRGHHEECWAGWSTSWNQDCWETY